MPRSLRPDSALSSWRVKMIQTVVHRYESLLLAPKEHGCKSVRGAVSSTVCTWPGLPIVSPFPLPRARLTNRASHRPSGWPRLQGGHLAFQALRRQPFLFRLIVVTGIERKSAVRLSSQHLVKVKPKNCTKRKRSQHPSTSSNDRPALIAGPIDHPCMCNVVSHADYATPPVDDNPASAL
ncbi:hypothetical protein BDW75DRAFT_49134 [Aspergillus navahoensis]